MISGEPSQNLASSESCRNPITRVARSSTLVRETHPERRRSTSAERAEKFLAETNAPARKRRRSKSPSSLDYTMPRRGNRGFCEKLALTAGGKWTTELESRWTLMEVEETE